MHQRGRMRIVSLFIFILFVGAISLSANLTHAQQKPSQNFLLADIEKTNLKVEANKGCPWLHTIGESNKVSRYQAPASECDTIQIILLIDQSSSMSVRNDPNGLRFYGPMNMVDILGKNYLQAKRSGDSLDRPIKIDLAVLHFGGSVDPRYLKWIRIAPADEQAWKDQKAEIDKLIKPDDLKLTTPSGTNFVTAFTKAEDLIAEQPQKDGCPKRLLIVLTDGNPDDGLGNPLRGKALTTHMNQVDKIVKRSFNGPQDQVFVTAFTSNDYYWEVSGGLWERITKDEMGLEPRKAKIVASLPEIGARLADIITSNLGDVIVKIHPGPVVVPPYVQQLRITFYPPDPSDAFEIYDPNNQILDPSRSDIQVTKSGQGTAVQVLEILNPPPGTYSIRTTAKSDNVLITMQPTFIRTDIVSPKSMTMEQFTSGRLQIKLLDSQGQEITFYNDPRYQLKVKACMVGDTDEVPVSLAPSGANLLEGGFTSMISGRVRLHLQAIALDEAGEEWKVLDGFAGTFFVDPVTVVTGEARGEGGCQPFQYQPFFIPLKFINSSTNNPVTISLPITWQTDVFSPSHQPITDVMVKENKESAGEYVLQVKTDEVGEVRAAISASAPNPADGTLTKFYTQNITVPVLDGVKTVAEIQGVEPLADAFSQWLPNFFKRFAGTPAGRMVLTGRPFFIRQTLTMTARLFNEEAGTLMTGESELPGLRLQSLKNDKIYTSGSWQSLGEGKYVAKMTAPPLGCYRFMTTADPTLCGQMMQVSPPAEAVCMVMGIGEQIFWALVSAAAVAGLYFLVAFLLCRFVNPLRGILGIRNVENSTQWYKSIEGRSCLNEKIPNPQACCHTKRVKVRAWMCRKNELNIIVQQVEDLRRGRLVTKKYSRNLNNWQDIRLSNGCRIIWRPKDIHED